MAARLRRLGSALIVVLALAGCGPDEADQRQAFIAFLQTEVLPRPGARLPMLDQLTSDKVGDYAKHYAVISRFHAAMDASVARPMQEVMAKGAPRSLEDIVARRSDIEAVRAGLAKMREALDRAEASARERAAALDRPGDLARVYDAAFDKLVTRPAAAFRDVFPTVEDAMTSVSAMAALIERNRASIKLQGSTVETADATLREKIAAALADMSSRQTSIAAAQDRFRRVMLGR